MAPIQRLYDFQAGTKIISGQVDAEFNQLISYVNGLEEPNFAFTGTLANTDWTGSSAPYTKAVTVTGILGSGKTPTVDVVLSTTWATALTEEAEWAKIKRIAYTNDTLTFYATAVPSVALNFTGVQPK